MDFEAILTFLLKKEVMITLVAIFLLTVFLLIRRKRKINKLRKMLTDYEVKYNSIKSVPLSFKLNKVVALAKVDESLCDLVNQYKDQFDHIHVNLKEITSMLSEMEDNIISGNLKKADLNAIDLLGMLERSTSEVNKLDNALDNGLKQEVSQREKINQIKEQFRELKNTLNQQPDIYEFSIDKINNDVKKIESAFTEFEELMYLSDFNKANDTMIQLGTDISALKVLLDNLPELLQLAKGTIPQLIDKVSQAYSLCKQKGLYLQHLDVAKNIELITDTLKQDLSQLRLGNIDEVQKDLEEYQKRLTQLNIQIEHEDSAYIELNELKTTTFALVEKTYSTLDNVKKLYIKVSNRYGFADIETTLNEFQTKITELDNIKTRLAKLIAENTVPASTILISLKEFEQELTELANKVDDLKGQLDGIKGDEDRAKKQLLKLYLIVNEIQVKIRKHRLPEISDQYEGDLRKANEYLRTLANLLNEEVLNTNLLATTLQEAIDFVYLLYNNVNNLVGMALMVENTIVFGNKYRSSYPEVDSELTRAELNFRNGEYTQALTIAMNAIERLNLEGYQQQIKENATGE